MYAYIQQEYFSKPYNGLCNLEKHVHYLTKYDDGMTYDK